MTPEDARAFFLRDRAIFLRDRAIFLRDFSCLACKRVANTPFKAEYQRLQAEDGNGEAGWAYVKKNGPAVIDRLAELRKGCLDCLALEVMES